MVAEIQEVQEWLEWAGSLMLSLGSNSPYPKGYKSNWPDYANEAQTAYGYTGERLRPATPRPLEIELMDKILRFPALIQNPIPRRIVGARAMVTPISNRYLYSWERLAQLLDMDRRKVKRLHHLGLSSIAMQLTVDKIDALRRLLPALLD